MQPFVVFNQIVAQLATANPDLLDNIFVQDPAILPEMKMLFENHGCQVVQDPAAFEKVGADGASTFFFPARLSTYLLAPKLRFRPYRRFPMFLGNGTGMLKDVGDFAREDPPYYKEVIEGMLGVESCKRELLPPNTPDSVVFDENRPLKEPGSFDGIRNFELWWMRPVKK